MKKLNYLFVALLTLLAPAVAGCSEDDNVKVPEIETGEIQAKNLYVTIDGTFIFNREGSATLSGTTDPTASEQHLQLSCEPMFITYYSVDKMVKEVPTFDIVIKTENGKKTVSGRYDGGTSVIDLMGELSVNYNGETDWRLVFTQEKTAISASNNGNYLSGKTFEFELTDDNVYCQPITYNPLSYNDPTIKEIFRNILIAYKQNSGYTAVRISFTDDYNYEISFKDESGAYVKDGMKHKYICMINSIAFLDERAFNKEQSEFLDLRTVGIGYICGENLISNQTLVLEPNSTTEYCVTCFNSKGPYSDGTLYLIFEPSDKYFLRNWRIVNGLGTAIEHSFYSYSLMENSKEMEVCPTIKANVVN